MKEGAQRQTVSKRNLLMTNLSRLSPMRGGDTLAKETKSKQKESSVPNQEEATMCSFIIRKVPIVKSVSRQKQHGQV